MSTDNGDAFAFMIHSKGKLLKGIRWLVAAGAISIFLACGAESPTAAPHPIATPTPLPPEPTATVAAMATQAPTATVAAMATQAPTSTVAATATQAPTATLVASATPAPTATPVAAATQVRPTPQQPTPPLEAEDGICWRNPEVQEAIIERLKIQSCQIINAGELFRLRELQVDTAAPLQPGDFADMPNLLSLEVRIQEPLPPGVFVGLDGLENLLIKASSYYSLDEEGMSGLVMPKAFDGLGNLKSLRIGGGSTTPALLEPGTLDGLEQLETLRVDGVIDIKSGAFDSLPALQELRLSALRIPNPNTGESERPILPRGTFKALPALQEVDLESFDRPETLDFYNPEVVCNLARSGRFLYWYWNELPITVAGEPAEVLQSWDSDDNCLVEVGDTIVKLEQPDS